MNRLKLGLGISHSGKQKCINATLSPRKYKPIKLENVVIAGKINRALLSMCIYTFVCVHIYTYKYGHIHIYTQRETETKRDNICIK